LFTISALLQFAKAFEGVKKLQDDGGQGCFVHISGSGGSSGVPRGAISTCIRDDVPVSSEIRVARSMAESPAFFRLPRL
jgi:hypothetical protein